MRLRSIPTALALTFVASLLTVIFGCAAKTQVVHLGPDLVIADTFSNIHPVIGKGLFGVEVRIVVTDNPQYQAVIQFSAGDFCNPKDYGSDRCFRPSNVIVTEARFDDDRPAPGKAHVTFRLPASSGYEGTFDGLISTKSLDGVFTFATGGRLQVVLKRKGRRVSGNETVLLDFPHFSPSGNRVLVLLVNREPVGFGVQMWRREGHQFILDWSGSPHADDYTDYRLVRWAEEDTVALYAENQPPWPNPKVKTNFELRRSRDGWKVADVR